MWCMCSCMPISLVANCCAADLPACMHACINRLRACGTQAWCLMAKRRSSLAMAFSARVLAPPCLDSHTTSLMLGEQQQQ